MTITDELLYSAAPQATDWLLGTLPSRADCDHVFSHRFERKLRHLLAQQRRSPRQNAFVHGIKRAAMIALVALLSALTITMSVEALREQLFRVVSSVWENGIQYYIRAEERDALYFHKITLGVIPEGFELDWEHSDERDLWSYYNVSYAQTKEGTEARSFSVSQKVMDRYSGSFGDLEQEEITVQGDQAFLQADETGTCLFWIHGPNIMTVTGTRMTREEILEIAENIQW